MLNPAIICMERRIPTINRPTVRPVSAPPTMCSIPEDDVESISIDIDIVEPYAAPLGAVMSICILSVILGVMGMLILYLLYTDGYFHELLEDFGVAANATAPFSPL